MKETGLAGSKHFQWRAEGRVVTVRELAAGLGVS